MFKKKSSRQNTEEESPASPKGEPSRPTYGQPDVGGGVDPTGGQGGIIGKFSTGKRRLKENIAQKAGKEAVDNSEFEERCQKVADLREKVGKVRDAMKRQLDCSRALCLACADLGNVCSEVGLRDVDFQNAQFQLDEDLRKQLDAAVAHALESLENKMAPFADLDKMIMSRNKLKLDFDHYTRKVRDLKEKPGAADAAKLSNNEAKLTAARQRLQEATGKVYKGFGYYDAVGGTLCQPEVEMLKHAQQGFFGSAFSVVKGMRTRDPDEVAREVEAAGKDGMNTPFALPAGEYGSSGGGGLSNMTGMSSSIKDTFRAGGGDSPHRSPSSAYVPSSSAPWLAGGAGGGGSAGAAVSAGTGSFKAPAAGGGGTSWWDKHAPTSDTQSVAAASSAWGAGAGAKAPAVAQQRVRALFSYSATDNTELSLTEGEVLTVLNQDQSGWWMGEKGGRRGLFPANYVNLI